MRKNTIRNSCLIGLLAALVLLVFAVPGFSGEVVVKDANPQIAKKNTLFDQFLAGGLVMYPLALCSLAMIGYGLERMSNLRKSRIVPDGLAEQASSLWQAGRTSEVEALCLKSGTVLGRIIVQMVKHRGEDAYRLRDLAGDVGSREMRLQVQKAYPLAIIAALAPLLGLLGTVSGMIDAFDTVALAGSLGNPALLADSISKAMVATGTGLMVAIPSLAGYHMTKSRTMIFSVQIEEAISGILDSRNQLDRK